MTECSTKKIMSIEQWIQARKEVNDGLTGQFLYVYVDTKTSIGKQWEPKMDKAAVAGPTGSAPIPATIEMRMGTRKMTLTNHCT